MNRLIPYSDEVYAYLLTAYIEGYAAVEVIVGLALVVFLIKGAGASRLSCRGTAVCLAMLWAWIGIGFYWHTYQPLNWAGTYFGWAALTEAVLIGAWGATTGGLRPDVGKAVPSHWAGLLGLVLAALIGPFMRLYSGDTVVAVQAIGVTPLATITATLSLFLLNRTRIPFWLFPLPVMLLVWESIRALVLFVMQDIVLLIIATVVLICLVHRLSKPGKSRL
ncbi:hypothetical protein EOI86_10720 [Hwanghaeella grinnelliae]|uniref:Uncharacterized protein n=1 Tax=Hwanghaeella grinnelliae TaxID=2500179 RepID=A0A437QYT0_9PROT|nr:DUF6064 family protein [Hwanghaeella grinnelliae]RVU39667.1 hypothetical protein EOI86_10720 [Hwanghaeella grinnelliae]